MPRIAAGLVLLAGAGPGDGGTARVVAGRVDVDRGGIVASSTGSGDAGSVSVRAGEGVSVRNGGDIGATADTASGGNILVRTPRLTLRGSEINAEAGDTGGSITLRVADLLYLFRSQLNADGERHIGNIDIDPKFTVLDHSRIVTQTNGGGGNIKLVTERLFQSKDSTITVADGATLTLTVFNPDANITGSLVPVNAPLFDKSLNFAEECARRLEILLSSFLSTGRGATSPEPGGLAPATDLTLTPSGR
jgi:hypothetical protein